MPTKKTGSGHIDGDEKTDSLVVLLHGWPGTRSDYRHVTPLLETRATVVAPNLQGFGDAYDGQIPLSEASADAHADRILQLIGELGQKRVVVAGYDIGSRVAQAIARKSPDSIHGLVVTPAYPGIGSRAFDAAMQPHYWYQHFHRLPVAADVLDGNMPAIRAYLRHFWSAWSTHAALAEGPSFDALVDAYSRPGALRASVAWYSANRGYSATAPVTVPTTMLWAEHDPLFPIAWADRLNDWFTAAELRIVPNSGHFLPLEAPDAFARAVLERLQ